MMAATNADAKVREVLAVAKELHAAQQQSMRLMATYKDLMGKLPGEVWADSGILHVVDANRTVWRMMWTGSFPTVERVAAVDVNEAVGEPMWERNEKPAAASTPSFPKVVYTEGRPVAPEDDAPAMWREAQNL